MTIIFLFLGLVIGYLIGRYQRYRYKHDGNILVQQLEGKKLFTLELEGDPEDILLKSTVSFKVVEQ